MTDARQDPFVTIAVPVVDEEQHLEQCLRSLVAQWPAERLEVLVLDGGSTDRSVAVAQRVGQDHDCVRVVPNPQRHQSWACNLAAEIADERSGIVVRADAHAVYPPDFVRLCVKALIEHGATSVVVPMRTVGIGGVQRAIAAAQNSPIGNGGSLHRAGGRSGWVDHGHHAAFERLFFRRIGGYDTSFVANEDVDHDLRARDQGGAIWMCAEAEMTYFPRSTFRGLAQQYYRYGAGRARTMQKHRYRPKLRHLASVGILFGTVGGSVLAIWVPVSAVAPIAYVGACLSWGCWATAAHRDRWLVLAGPAAMVMHHAWAVGFLASATAPRTVVVGRPVAPSPSVIA